MSALAGWRLALRLARREAGRARRRSLLMLVMIALPVLAVTAADVVARTASVSSVESIDRRLGQASALVQFHGDRRVVQAFDPERASSDLDAKASGDADLATVRRVLGARSALALQQGTVRVITRAGVADADVVATDLRRPLAAGLFRLGSGRLPRTTAEVAVSPALAARGPALGHTLTVAGGDRRRVVGIVDSTSVRGAPQVVGLVGSLDLDLPPGTASYLVGGGAVSWSDVRRLNDAGGLVTSRAVLEAPPPASALPAQIRPYVGGGGVDPQELTVVALVAAMALLEVVLLAGPAFAVGASRQRRTLALIGASGGTPRQMRRVVLATGVVMGATASLVGAGLGIVVGWAVLPLAQRLTNDVFGPFEVSLRDLVLVVVFGLASALLAAVAPAWIASRQDVVAVLGGRRGDRRPGVRSPLLGVLLLAAGIAVSVLGTRGRLGELSLAAGAVLCVLAMILLVPVVLALLGRLARRLPLVGRYAVRDAARHRTRTVPAIAAVGATVAGVVAIGIGVSSQNAQDRATYTPSLDLGSASVVGYDLPERTWTRLAATVAAGLPGARVARVEGASTTPPGGDPGSSVELSITRPGGTAPMAAFGSPFGSPFVVDDGSDLTRLQLGIPADRLAAARRTLASGALVVLTPTPVDATRAVVHQQGYDASGAETTRSDDTYPTTYVTVSPEQAHAQAVVPPSVVHALGLSVVTDGLLVSGTPVSPGAEQDLSERVAAIDSQATFSVERGFQPDQDTRVLQLVLTLLGAVLMVGGTITATFLALSDARGDLATLAAVGAAPRTRRGVAAAYAWVIGGVGAVLGALVGLVPGIAVSYPLTDGSTGTHYLDVPWLQVAAVVVVLPALIALLVGLVTRGRLPMVARID